MSLKLTAYGRRKARSVCIVTALPVRLQEKKSADTKTISSHVVRLAWATIIISQSASSEVTIVLEPP